MSDRRETPPAAASSAMAASPRPTDCAGAPTAEARSSLKAERWRAARGGFSVFGLGESPTTRGTTKRSRALRSLAHRGRRAPDVQPQGRRALELLAQCRGEAAASPRRRQGRQAARRAHVRGGFHRRQPGTALGRRDAGVERRLETRARHDLHSPGARGARGRFARAHDQGAGVASARLLRRRAREGRGRPHRRPVPGGCPPAPRPAPGRPRRALEDAPGAGGGRGPGRGRDGAAGRGHRAQPEPAARVVPGLGDGRRVLLGARRRRAPQRQTTRRRPERVRADGCQRRRGGVGGARARGEARRGGVGAKPATVRRRRARRRRGYTRGYNNTRVRRRRRLSLIRRNAQSTGTRAAGAFV